METVELINEKCLSILEKTRETESELSRVNKLLNGKRIRLSDKEEPIKKEPDGYLEGIMFTLNEIEEKISSIDSNLYDIAHSIEDRRPKEPLDTYESVE